ncbi:MAG: DUF4038 domain-containing protein [Anaerolineae bacterium]|nr:DUF4038 domain-containing protein [Anaerolineae bacterium]
MKDVAKWTIFEAIIDSDRDYDNPFWDVAVRIELRSPSGKARTVDAFWDGGRAWRVRFSPDETGEWQWMSVCSDRGNVGLHDQGGRFACVPYRGDNPLYSHGPVGVSSNGCHFEYADGTPFFWLADTAWNGVLRAQEADWHRYLRLRREQRFTAIQFVCTHWRGCTRNSFGEVAFEGQDRVVLNPRFFQRMDAKVAAVNAYGLIAAPVLLWALTEADPGQTLSEEAAIRVVKYMVARWGAHQVIWFLGGDGHYDGERAERWKRIGNAVWTGGVQRDRLVTMHPCGQSWIGQEFRGQPWFDFIGYQSGHGSSDDHLRWLVEGPPARCWDEQPLVPVVNLEPNYEDHPSYHIQRKFDDCEVRRAAYWSLLVSPPAGVTFGHNAIWVWPDKSEVPEGHDRIGLVMPWRYGLETPGVHSMTVLRQFFGSLSWTEPVPWNILLPAPDLIIEQPGKNDPALFIAAAKTVDSSFAAIYTPQGGDIRIDLSLLNEPDSARWFDPRSGKWMDADVSEQIATPDERDWLLCIGSFGGI